jgi:acetylornithine deacetylase/succinyl-diaminopimelate desuccinylase-like protein
MEVPGRGDTVMLYGHLDKQPEMVGWGDGLGPWTPVRRGDKLYGRGAADDGYAAFAALTAIATLQQQGVPHARCVVLIEACEESGSYDLPAYVDALAPRIGTPGLVVCLDSGCADYEHLWCTTSLRGIVNGVLTVEVLTEGIHSGASGVVPSSFRILRALLSRVEDERTGEILLRDLHVDIPGERLEQARAVAELTGKKIAEIYPLVKGMRLAHEDSLERVLAGTWRPALSLTGAAGLPQPADGGNVLRPKTAAKLSLRLPPTVNAVAAARRVKETLEAEPPYGARVTFEVESPGSGWDAPATERWLLDAMHEASQAYFGQPAMFQGTGGSIPFMAMLGQRYPRAQFMITGVLGPGSNAHGPNEFLHVPTGVRVTACVAHVLAAHAGR